MTDFKTLSADLETHPITGYLNTGQHLNVPLISHIKENLYVGGTMHGVSLDGFFKHIISMYPWEFYKEHPETSVHYYKMYDGKDVDVETLEEAAAKVSECLDEGGPVLVVCQAGVNRSNLVAATVLMQRDGLSGHEAVELLRKQRSELVLSNPDFYSYLTRS